MAVFRNTSGQDRQLALPELGEILEVADGATVNVPDDVALAYDFSQGGVWAVVDPPVDIQDAQDVQDAPDATGPQDEPVETAAGSVA